MSSMSFNLFSDSPTMVLSPQEPPHTFVDPSSFQQSDSRLLTPNNFSQWTPSSSRTPVYTAPSRKRSRDESTLADHDYFQDGSYFPRAPAPPPSMPKYEPMYGEGMTLLNPVTGISISAESQTGTWFEEAAAAKVARIPQPPSSSTSTSTGKPIWPIKPALPSRKSQRLDTSAPGLDDIAFSTLSSDTTGIHSCIPSKSTPLEPAVDDSTHLLGIGWTRLPSDDDAVAAARGWAKYINNHYPGVRDAQILLQSNGLSAYLVAAADGFYLFKEDLSEGRLVGRSWKACLANLRAVPMGFEGGQVLRAAGTPEAHRGAGGGGEMDDGCGALGGGMDLD